MKTNTTIDNSYNWDTKKFNTSTSSVEQKNSLLNF
jgi:hypothetical protein